MDTDSAERNMHRKNPEKALTVCICVVIDNNDLALTLSGSASSADDLQLT